MPITDVKLPPRFYCPLLPSSGMVTLPEGEAHHAAHVLRLGAGSPVELFNGRGLVGQGMIETVHKRGVACTVSATEQQTAASPEVILATAVPKGERFDWLVEKAAELGVSRLIPLHTARSAVDPRDSKLDRLRQTVIAACKQSRRSFMMELSPVTDWRTALEQFRHERLLMADVRGVSLREYFTTSSLSDPRPWVVCIGPEGGLTADEISFGVELGGQLISLGMHWLRIETAAIAWASWGCLWRHADEIGRSGG